MKIYRLKKSNHKQYKYIIFASSYQNPLEQREKIERDLASRKYSGPVVIDFLLSTGNSPTRFQVLSFDGSKLDLRSAYTSLNDMSLRNFASKFYYQEFEKLDTSILSKPIRFKLTNLIRM